MTMHMDKTLPDRKESVGSRYLEFLLAIIMPPIAVLLNRGPTRKFVISIVLTILGYFPGLIYAFYVLLSDIEETLE